MRFLTWNICSGGGRRIPSITAALAKAEPDFVALTEVTYNNLEVLRTSLRAQGLEHMATTCAEGRTNSVLVASRIPFTVADEPVVHDPARWLAVEIESLDLKILCVHIPASTDNKFDSNGLGVSGRKRKELFWDQVVDYSQRHKNDRVILLGDFNTGLPEDAQGTPFELSDRIRILRLEKYADAWRAHNSTKREYTWYSKRKNKELGTSEDLNGFRLDYVFVSSAVRDHIVDVCHIHDVRSAGLSDHSMVVADLGVGTPQVVRSISRVGDLGDKVSVAAVPASETELKVQSTSRPVVVTAPGPARLGAGYFAQKQGDWTRDEFIDSVEDPGDRAFLLRLLELADENDLLESRGPAPRLYFGKQPGGAMFVYHFGRRHPPYKFSIRNGHLMIAGCWTRFPQVVGDPGFADLASMLHLDEKSSAKAVPVTGLDPDDVWQVGETVSQAING